MITVYIYIYIRNVSDRDEGMKLSQRNTARARPLRIASNRYELSGWWQASRITGTTISRSVARYSFPRPPAWRTTTWDRSWTRARYWCTGRRNCRLRATRRQTITGSEGRTARARSITSGSTTWRTTRSNGGWATTSWSGSAARRGGAGVYARPAPTRRNTTRGGTRTETRTSWEIETRTRELRAATWPRTGRAPPCPEGGEDERCRAASRATHYPRTVSHQTEQLSTIGASSRAAPAHRVNSSSPLLKKNK